MSLDLRAFRWQRRPGHAPLALAAHGLLWKPLAPKAAPVAVPQGALLLFPERHSDVPAVIDHWLRLYAESPKGIEEAVLQVHDDSAHLRDYVAAERALWELIYEAHPHKEDEGIVPRALDEAEWLLDAVLGHHRYEDRNEFLTQAAFETVARELLITVRRAEMQHLRDHLRGLDTVSGW